MLVTIIKNSNKNDRNIIFYNNNINIDEFKNKYKLTNWMSTDNLYLTYKAKIYNPPFFNNIISIQENNVEEVQKIWNMTILNGYFIISNKFKNLFKNIIEEHNNFILIHKNIYKLYTFPKYRIIDFIIAGTMKGGTTAGITNLNKHKDINMTKNEIQYFDNLKNYQKT